MALPSAMYAGLVNSPETTITNNLGVSDTTIYVLDATRIPASLPNLLVLGTGTNAETVRVTAVNDNALTVSRAFQGTAKEWPAGTVIARNFTAYDHDAFIANIQSLYDSLILWLDQALKTVSSPTFAGLTINGNIVTSGTVDGVDISAFLDQAVKIASRPTFGGLTVNGNITTSGTVDGVDISAVLDQAVKTASSPTFAGMTLNGVDLAASLSQAVWQSAGAFTRVTDSTYTVEDNAANQAIHCKGRPVRYADTLGTYGYGVITNYVSGTVTIAGVPMTTSFDTILQYGPMHKVVQVDVLIGGTFAPAASTGLINGVLKSNLLWRYGQAYLVRIAHIVDSDDSGAAQSRVNVSIAGDKVCTANTDAGLAVAETWSTTVVDINPSNYNIALDEEIEITVDANGTNKDAKELTVSMTFVLAE